jgi:hypothetical protein
VWNGLVWKTVIKAISQIFDPGNLAAGVAAHSYGKVFFISNVYVMRRKTAEPCEWKKHCADHRGHVLHGRCSCQVLPYTKIWVVATIAARQLTSQKIRCLRLELN